MDKPKLSKAMIAFFKGEIMERGFEIVKKEWEQAEFEVYKQERDN